MGILFFFCIRVSQKKGKKEKKKQKTKVLLWVLAISLFLIYCFFPEFKRGAPTGEAEFFGGHSALTDWCCNWRAVATADATGRGDPWAGGLPLAPPSHHWQGSNWHVVCCSPRGGQFVRQTQHVATAAWPGRQFFKPLACFPVYCYFWYPVTRVYLVLYVCWHCPPLPVLTSFFEEWFVNLLPLQVLAHFPYCKGGVCGVHKHTLYRVWDSWFPTCCVSWCCVFAY